jgi:prepilin-type processing-associated H-X9-DG protein
MLEQGAIYDKFNFNLALKDNAALGSVVFPVQRCPSDIAPLTETLVPASGTTTGVPDQATTSYCASAGIWPDDLGSSTNAYGGGLNAAAYSSACFGLINILPATATWEKDISVDFSSISDGTSNTILIGEVSWAQTQTQRWYGVTTLGGSAINELHRSCLRLGRFPPNRDAATPSDINPGTPGGPLTQAQWSFGSEHRGSAQFVFADGSVKVISDNIDSKIVPEPPTAAGVAQTSFSNVNYRAQKLLPTWKASSGMGIYQRLHTRNDDLTVDSY